MLHRRLPPWFSQGRGAGAVSATRRLAAILAADVAGYSRLIGADEEGTLERLRSIRNAVDGHPRHRRSEQLDRLVITRISVDQATTVRRFMPRAMGRATRINRKTSHATVVLSDNR